MRYILILVLATVAYTVMALFYKIEMNNSIFFVSLLWLLPLSIRFGNYVLMGEVESLKDELEQAHARRDTLSGKLEDVKHQRKYLEEKLSQLSKLYAITKDMSSNVRFSELSGSLKDFLEDNFKFGTFKIILFKYENSKKSIDKIYEIGAETNHAKLNEAFCDLTDSVAKSKKPMLLEREKNEFNFKSDPKLKNILAVPLMARKRVIAAFLIENIRKDDYDKFLILASQVALQIERIGLFDDVEQLSIMDGLTGTFLRRYFLERFGQEISRAQESKMNLAFIMVDLDHFKQCNDNFGHLVGDVALEEVADILKQNIREIDLVARFGGEEFCVLLPETQKSGAFSVAERIRKAVESRTIKAYDESIKITISMGISSFPEDSKNLDGLIESADKALYEAKKHGRNRICVAGCVISR